MAAYSDGRDEQNNREIIAQVGATMNDIFAAAAGLALISIQTGSALTGAPGQPVDEGTLLRSWLLEFDGPDVARIGSPLEYAEPVEDAVGPHGPRVYGKKNNIGGSHSVKLTAANFDRLTAEATRLVLEKRP